MITERAMLAAVHISIWTAVKHDRKISREVCRFEKFASPSARLDSTFVRHHVPYYLDAVDVEELYGRP
jgi:hypothetical protein